ncbi:MAG: hypothetical protein AABZ83_10230, partial [candidate division NC10 bacterium]
MGKSPTRALLTVVLVALSLIGCAAPMGGGAATHWKEDPGATVAPELARFNTLLADLAERMKPGLVHVRVRRAAKEGAKEEPGDERGCERHIEHDHAKIQCRSLPTMMVAIEDTAAQPGGHQDHHEDQA